MDTIWTPESIAFYFLTPMVVKIYLSSSTSDYILTRIVWLISEAPQEYRVFEALLSSLACFVNHPPCHGRDLPRATSGTFCFLPGVFLLFRAIPSRIWGSVRERVRVFPSGNQGGGWALSWLRQSDERICPHVVARWESSLLSKKLSPSTGSSAISSWPLKPNGRLRLISRGFLWQPRKKGSLNLDAETYPV